MARLFPATPEILPLPDGELRLWPDFIPANAAEFLLQALIRDVRWQQSRIFIAGQYRVIPRLNAWYGGVGAEYRYSNTQMVRHDWLPMLEELRRQTADITGHDFNSALLNLYRDGRDSVDWHSDDEPELGADPHIATVSLGAERALELRRKGGGERRRLLLPTGSLLLMNGALQQAWQHRIAKVPALQAPRISITFRAVVSAVALHLGEC